MEEKKNPWRVESEKEIYNNEWINLTEYNVINPSGGKGIYGKVHFKNIAIGIVPIDNNRNIYLVGQFRFTINQYSWEIPEGGCPENEQPLDAAKRELHEETGLYAQQWTRILQLYLSNSITDEYCEIFLAKDVYQQQTAHPEETEQLKIKKVPFEQAYNMVEHGEITDAITVAALQKLKLMFYEGKL